MGDRIPIKLENEPVVGLMEWVDLMSLQTHEIYELKKLLINQ